MYIHTYVHTHVHALTHQNRLLDRRVLEASWGGGGREVRFTWEPLPVREGSTSPDLLHKCCSGRSTSQQWQRPTGTSAAVWGEWLLTWQPAWLPFPSASWYHRVKGGESSQFGNITQRALSCPVNAYWNVYVRVNKRRGRQESHLQLEKEAL